MNEYPEQAPQPPLPPEWPPPLASRAVRRHCHHQVKAGYCAVCGTPVRKPEALDG